MLTHEYLESVIQKIDCIKCGGCCPTDCTHLVNGRCDIHPDQHKVDQKYGACELPPINLVLHRSVFCPPVIEVIKEKTGIDIGTDPDDQRFCDTNSLNQALQSEISVE